MHVVNQQLPVPVCFFYSFSLSGLETISFLAPYWLLRICMHRRNALLNRLKQWWEWNWSETWNTLQGMYEIKKLRPKSHGTSIVPFGKHPLTGKKAVKETLGWWIFVFFQYQNSKKPSFLWMFGCFQPSPQFKELVHHPIEASMYTWMNWNIHVFFWMFEIQSVDVLKN